MGVVEGSFPSFPATKRQVKGSLEGCPVNTDPKSPPHNPFNKPGGLVALKKSQITTAL